MLEEGTISPFYLDKIRDDQVTRVPSALCMSILYYVLQHNYTILYYQRIFLNINTYPFEYYIFHFAYHLTNPWLQLQQQENVWANWETVYVQLAHYYLYHFLPKDNSAVLPIIGPYIKKAAQRKLSQSPEIRRYNDLTYITKYKYIFG